ncbi:MAG: capsule assembly Wzi family protein [Balneolaceae bacterium]
MIWQASIWLWLLLLAPLVAGLGVWAGVKRRRRLGQAVSARLQTNLRQNMSPRLRRVRLSLLLLAFSFFVIALAGPSLGTEVREVEQRSLEMIVALDLSRSMLSEDVAPSRLEKARFEIQRLIERSPGDRIGLIVFTGQAFLQSPMTSDASALRLYLSTSHPDQMPGGTTRLREALSLALETFERRDQTGDAARVLVLVSDGEDQGSEWRAPLQELASTGVQVYGVGIGTEAGGRIPVTDPETGAVVGFQRDREGQEVNTRLDIGTLREVAREGGGELVTLTRSGDGVDPLLARLGELERGEVSVEQFADYANRYQWLLLSGLFLAVVAFLLPRRARVATGSVWLVLIGFGFVSVECGLAQSGSDVLNGDPISVTDSLSVGWHSVLGSGRETPFWQSHNRFGRVDEGGPQTGGHVTVIQSSPGPGRLGWSWGGTGLARFSESSSLWLQEGWARARYGSLHLEAGRREQTLGETGPSALSSGSLALGQNATPVPRVLLAIPEFAPVPWTRGWVSIKGRWGHGWLGNGREVSGSYLHEKAGWLRFGKEEGLRAYGGIAHFAVWGGTESATGRAYPDHFSDYLRVITAQAGGDDSHGVDQVNTLGAHQGIWDAGIQVEDPSGREWHLYHQHLFSDGSGLLFRNLRDGLYGLSVARPFGERIPWIDHILYEFLHTKHQTGPGPTDPVVGDSPPFCAPVNPNCGYRYNGRDDYYNNEVYRDGWAYHGRSMGSPLFLTRGQLNRIDPTIETYDPRYFVSTRQVAHHLGLKGRASRNLSWRLLATRVSHHGTWWGLNLGDVWGSLDPALDPEVYYFNPQRVQWHWLLEGSWSPPAQERLTIELSAGLDHGDLFERVGLSAGFVWDLR